MFDFGSMFPLPAELYDERCIDPTRIGELNADE